MQAQLREVQAGYRRLGDDVAFQQEQLWNQVLCWLTLGLTWTLTMPRGPDPAAARPQPYADPFPVLASCHRSQQDRHC